MIIENQESFKTWLATVLEPLCEADPLALAKYVCALVKKDKPLGELKDGMVDQLDVFLQDQTKPFVDLLFKTLETQEYLTLTATAVSEAADTAREAEKNDPTVRESIDPQISIETAKTENFVDQEPEFDDRRDTDKLTNAYPDKKDAKSRIVLNRNNKFTPATVPKPKPAFATEQTLVKVIPDLLEDSVNESLPLKFNKQDRKSDSDKEDRRRRGYRSRSRSRSRSFDRVKRLGGAGPNSRQIWRNRSPLSNQRFERRRSRSGSPPSRAIRYRNRSPHPGIPAPDGLQSRSRSRSRERIPPSSFSRNRSSRDRERNIRDRLTRDRPDRNTFYDRDQEREREREKERERGASTPTQDSNPGDCAGQARRTTTTVAGVFAPVTKKRCRDFDERGYCMRGDLCQFDHGIDPVVLDQGSAFSGGMAMPMNNIPPPVPGRPPVPGCIGEYNPLTPDIWSGNRFVAPPMAMHQLPPPLHPHHIPQRELIPIPTMRVDDGRGGEIIPGTMMPKVRVPIVPGSMPPGQQFGPHPGGIVPPHIAKRRQAEGARTGQKPHVPKIGSNGNCSLELKKVPRGLNDIMHLNNHFSKFGKIVNIQVFFEGDPEAALITFSSHTEANVAYKSTEAVLNNRFIKVFWHNSDNKQENVPPGQRGPVKDRLTTPTINSNNHGTHNKVLINKENMKITTNALNEAKSALAQAQNLAQDNQVTAGVSNGTLDENPLAKSTEPSTTEVNNKPMETKANELAALVKKRGEGAAKISRDLRRRTTQLLEKQFQQMKMLLKKLEQPNITAAQRETLLTTIKALQGSVEKTKKELTIQKADDGQMSNALNKLSIGGKRKSTTVGSIMALKKVPKTKEEAQKEILDAELDLFTRQQEGQDVSELEKRIFELRRQQKFRTAPGRKMLLSSHWIMRKKLGVPLRSTKYTKGAVKAQFVNQSVDHRPKAVLISGYEGDEQEQVILHFAKFGEIMDKEIDPCTPSVWLHYKTRKEAETAFSKGKQFNDRTLSITWVTQPLGNYSSNVSANNSKTKNSDQSNSPPYASNLDEIDYEPGFDLSEDILLQDDEEEDEENEDRSWRR